VSPAAGNSFLKVSVRCSRRFGPRRRATLSKGSAARLRPPDGSRTGEIDVGHVANGEEALENVDPWGLGTFAGSHRRVGDRPVTIDEPMQQGRERVLRYRLSTAMAILLEARRSLSVDTTLLLV